MGINIEPVFGLSADDFAGDEDKVLLNALTTMTGHTGPRARTAPIHDHIKGRKNEIEFVNGPRLKKGQGTGHSHALQRRRERTRASHQPERIGNESGKLRTLKIQTGNIR